MIIRNIKPTDLKQLQNICIKTANFPLNKFKKSLCLMYCDYYAKQCQKTSFCVENDNEILGYIFSDINYQNYKSVYLKNYLPKLFLINPILGFFKLFDLFIQKKYGKKYIAHLHIDLLEKTQHKGYGTILVNTLFEKLKNENINSIYLIVNKKNFKAISFYKKCGFKIVKKHFYGLVLAYYI